MFWNTAKKLRRCVFPEVYTTNEDWFENFCSKVVPPYVPRANEIEFDFPLNYLGDRKSDFLTSPFVLSESSIAINSRRSAASGIDLISPLVLRNLPSDALNTLLNVLNRLFLNVTVPETWKQFNVIPIPKSNSSSSVFRPIAFSSSLCKIAEHIIKSRLDRWIEHYSVFTDRMFDFVNVWVPNECLSYLYILTLYTALLTNVVFLLRPS